MTRNNELEQLKKRLANAESVCSGWRAAGEQEKYLEACSAVQALELQLARAEVQAARDELSHDAPASLDAPAMIRPEAADQSSRTMLELGIGDNGRSYEYRGYCYEHLADAVDFARRDLVAGTGPGAATTLIRPPAVPPSEAQLALMLPHEITWNRGTFSLGEYRYDVLEDALAYARLRRPH
jgi:hypothetical protein